VFADAETPPSPSDDLGATSDWARTPETKKKNTVHDKAKGFLDHPPFIFRFVIFLSSLSKEMFRWLR
jgi:hypothetical protein